MARQAEARLANRVKKWLEAEFPTAVVVKLADRYTRGLPDLLLVAPFAERRQTCCPLVLFLEVKHGRGKETKLQRKFGERANGIGNRLDSGVVRYAVVRSVDETKTLIEGTVA